MKRKRRSAVGEYLKPARIAKIVDTAERLPAAWARWRHWDRTRKRFAKRLKLEGHDQVEVYRQVERLRGEIRAEVRTRAFAAQLAEREREERERANAAEGERASS